MACSANDFARLINTARKIRRIDKEADGLQFSEEGIKLWADLWMDEAYIAASDEQQEAIRDAMRVE